jgi:hypothetical protein
MRKMAALSATLVTVSLDWSEVSREAVLVHNQRFGVITARLDELGQYLLNCQPKNFFPLLQFFVGQH